MVDPYAPPVDNPAPRPLSPPMQEYQTPPAEPVHRRERPWRESRFDRERDRDRDHELRTEPARPGLFWVVAAVGIGMLLLARLVLYFSVADELPGDRNAPALFAVLGVIALSAGLCLAGILQRGLATPWRIALVLGAGFFAVVGWDPFGFVLA